MKYLKITHKQLGEAQVVPSAAHVWVERGWTVEGDWPTQTPASHVDDAEKRTAASKKGA